MSGCTVSFLSPQFNKLCKRWKRDYPHIETDLEDAFRAIAENIQAKKARRLSAVAGFEVYKYRQNSKDIRRGESYGWRIIALYDKPEGKMYPILVYPKPVLENADNETITRAITEIREILGYCIRSDCGGKMIAVAAANTVELSETDDPSLSRVQCNQCGAVAHRQIFSH